jgi:hypothetical protein
LWKVQDEAACRNQEGYKLESVVTNLQHVQAQQSHHCGGSSNCQVQAQSAQQGKDSFAEAASLASSVEQGSKTHHIFSNKVIKLK